MRLCRIKGTIAKGGLSMKNNKITTCLILFLISAVSASCNRSTAKTIIEIELTENYDTSDPFIYEKLIYVSDDINILDLDISIQIKGKRSSLEIADNETGQVFWSKEWNGNVDKTNFTISLDTLEKDKEYVIRFTGTKINYAKVVVTSENKLVKEREKPLRPNRD